MAPRKAHLDLPLFSTSEPNLHAIIAAEQYRFNYHNIESPWYPAYNMSVADLVRFKLNAGHGSLVSGPQIQMYISRSIFERVQLAHEAKNGKSGGLPDLDPESSFETTASTRTLTQDQDWLFLIPDISVVHMIAKPSKYNFRSQKIVHMCFPLILEIKSAPSRQDSDEMRLQSIPVRLSLALYFTKYPEAQEVVAVAATGAYWRWLRVQRGQLASLWYLRMVATGEIKRGSAEAKKLYPRDWTLSWNYEKRWQKRPYYILGQPESDEALMKMRANDLVPIVEGCKHFKPTRPVVVSPTPEEDEEMLSDRAETPDENEKEADLGTYGKDMFSDRAPTTDENYSEADFGGHSGEMLAARAKTPPYDNDNEADLGGYGDT
ncbi:hypothetical protein HGRIS_012375 [Hohenbuehelia grisea]|uniref:Uncharacterized protein n=1 Tax=Hohenbuehelia grisea TaxID=104357 RepID=A0ABR3IS61_9AGAR